MTHQGRYVRAQDQFNTAVIRPIQRDPDAPPLDPGQVHVFYDHKGFLRATVEDQTYLDVSIVRVSPQSVQDRYVGLLSGKHDEIGIVRDPTELDEESQNVIERELERRYFPTTIERVFSVKEEFGATYWHTMTNRGERAFVARGLRDNVQYLGKNSILINDVDGNRYEIEDLGRLDSESRGYVLRVV